MRFAGYCLVVIVFVVLAGCSGNDEKEKSAEVEENGGREQSRSAEVVYEPQLLSIKGEEAAALLQEEADTVVVDVRPLQERQQIRIPGAVAVSLMDIMQGKEELPRTKPLLLVCTVGGRSYAAGLYMLKNGYVRLYNLRGGISAWEKAGMALEAGGQ